MDLIDTWLTGCQQQKDVQGWLWTRHGQEICARLTKNMPQCSYSAFNSIENSLQIVLALREVKQARLIGKISIDLNTKILSVKLTLTKFSLLRCKAGIQKSMMNRYLLRRNKDKDFHLKAHPVTGDPCACFTFSIAQEHLSYEQLKNLITELLDAGTQQFLKEVPQLLFQMGLANRLEETQQLQKQLFHLSKLKVYMRSSQHYAWNILQGLNKNFKNQLSRQHFYQRKDNFLNEPRYFCDNENVKAMTAVFNTEAENLEFEPLSAREDQELYDRYLAKISMIIKDAKQFNPVVLAPQTIPATLNKLNSGSSECVLNCQGLGNVLVAAKKFPGVMAKRLQYQKQIIQRLTGSEFVGLAKYYYISNCQKQTECYRLTNLVKIKPYKNFLESNSQTISLITKISLLYQISVALKYMRDHSIVFHNLIPDSIAIKKGLLVKLFDFSNAYVTGGVVTRERFESPFFQLYQDKLPYVANIIFGKGRTFDDQKSDVYSFGILAFKAIFGRCPIEIRPSNLMNLRQTQNMLKILSQPSPYALEKHQSQPLTGILMTFLLLQCSECTQTHEETEDSSSESSKNLQRMFTKHRPFMDWIVVLFKVFFNYYNRL